MSLSLLVPLDRSAFAEEALPLALRIARRAPARVDMVTVHGLYTLENPHACWAPFQPAEDAKYREQEQLYLDATVGELIAVAPVSVTASVLSGSTVLPETVTDRLLERACNGQTDLIVMTTHGHGP